MTVNGLAHSRFSDEAYLNVPVRTLLRMCCVLILALVALAGPVVSPLGYLGICCGVYGAMVLMGLEHRKDVKRLMRTTTSLLPGVGARGEGHDSPSSSSSVDQEDLIRDLTLSGKLDMSRVIDIDFQEAERRQQRGLMQREILNQNPAGFEDESR